MQDSQLINLESLQRLSATESNRFLSITNNATYRGVLDTARMIVDTKDHVIYIPYDRPPESPTVVTNESLWNRLNIKSYEDSLLTLRSFFGTDLTTMRHYDETNRSWVPIENFLNHNNYEESAMS